MNSIKTNENFKTISVKENPVSESRICRWIGWKDCTDSLNAYQKKDYASAINSLAIAILKFGIISAATYGVYKLLSVQTVYLNDLIKQAEDEFKKNSNTASVPSSVEQIIKKQYSEYTKFNKWPQSERKIFENHLESDAPMSSKIIEHLLAEGTQQKDTSFQRWAVRTCQSAATSSLSCLTLLDFLTKSSNSKSLDAAMSISGRCKTNSAFCRKSLDLAKQQSIQQEDIEEVRMLVIRMNRKGANLENGAGFLKEATALFNKQFQKLEKAIADCQKAKEQSGIWNTAACFRQAPVHQKLLFLFRKDDFFDWQEDETVRNLKKTLTDYGSDLTKACAKFPNSEPCQKFISDTFQKLLKYDLFNEAFALLLQKGSLKDTEISDLLSPLLNRHKLNELDDLIQKVEDSKPDAYVQDVINTFKGKIQEIRDNAKQALESMSNAGVEEAALCEAVETAFQLTDDTDHFLSIFKVAYSWINNKDVTHQKALKLIIRNLFALDSCISTSDDCTYRDTANIDMAKILVTRWHNALDSWKLSASKKNWYIHNNVDSQYDVRYSYSITKDNWETYLPSQVS